MCRKDERQNDEYNYKSIIAELARDGDYLIHRALTDESWESSSRLEFLAAAYLFGRHGIRPNAEKGVYLMHTAAAAGNTTASYYLAECLNFGIGTKQDRPMSKLYYLISMRNAYYRADAKRRLHELEE